LRGEERSFPSCTHRIQQDACCFRSDGSGVEKFHFSAPIAGSAAPAADTIEPANSPDVSMAAANIFIHAFLPFSHFMSLFLLDSETIKNPRI